MQRRGACYKLTNILCVKLRTHLRISLRTHLRISFAKMIPVYLPGYRLFSIANGEFGRASQSSAARKSASERYLSSPRLGMLSLCAAADEGVDFLNQRWFTVWCNAVSHFSSLHSCSTGSDPSRPRTLHCDPLPKQAGWRTAHAVEVGHCSSSLHKCSSGSSLLQTSRACHCDPCSSAACGSVDFFPLTGRT